MDATTQIMKLRYCICITKLMERFVQVLLLLVIVISSSCYSFGSVIESDESSLVALKAAITSDPHNILARNWSSASPVCRWVGVTCDSSHSRVTELDLSNMGLVGSIAPEIGNISSLVSLNMSGNFLHGPIPPSIFNMSSLEDLVLFDNRLSGRLPRGVCSHNRKLKSLVLYNQNNLYGEISALSLHHCSQLEVIDLEANNFDGHVPREIGNITSLKFLNLYENNISGRIPQEVGKLDNLEILDMGVNNLSGNLPPTISNMSSLTYIGFAANMLSGALPIKIGNLKALQTLFLYYNAFTGNIPGELFNTSIKSISLAYNFFEGSIPPDIGKSHNLYFLNLASNKLSGPIPSTIGNPSNLNIINLSSNELIGEIPSTIGNLSNLNILLLSSNRLIGGLPFSIANMTSLRSLVLSNNSLDGAIPRFNNLLRILHLNGNHFSGPIPSKIFTEGCLAITINLNGNQLKGRLPKSLLNCKRLQGLDIGNNGIRDKFPSWMDALPHLRVLVLRSNNFHGTILSLPRKTDQLPFPMLQVLDVSRNSFTGPLPERYFKNFRAMINVVNSTGDTDMQILSSYTELIITFKGADQLLERLLDALTTVDFSCNAFAGTIPASIGGLISLKYLNLSHNNLIGNMPASLGNMTALESLDLSANKLDGEIPRELARLTFISVLNVSMNNLVGEIPKSTQFSTFGNDSFMGNPGLCGLPLTRKCKEEENGQEDDDMNSDGFVDGFTWRAVVMGYGCGLAVGIAVGYSILICGRPICLLEFFFGATMRRMRRRRRRS